MLYMHIEHLLEIGVCFTNHAHILPTKLDKCRCFLVREIWIWSGKCQGILLSIICGNPVEHEAVRPSVQVSTEGPGKC